MIKLGSIFYFSVSGSRISECHEDHHCFRFMDHDRALTGRSSLATDRFERLTLLHHFRQEGEGVTADSWLFVEGQVEEKHILRAKDYQCSVLGGQRLLSVLKDLLMTQASLDWSLPFKRISLILEIREARGDTRLNDDRTNTRTNEYICIKRRIFIFKIYNFHEHPGMRLTVCCARSSL